MKDAFVERSPELRLLQRAWASPDSGLIPVYGRRRVGKSALIRHFMDQSGGVYLVGKQAPAALQIREFLRVAAEALGQPLLARVSAEGWKDALSLVVAAHKGRGKLLLALDEFQWMCGASPELTGVIQEFWDTEWSRSGAVLLLLCGSFIGFMERDVLGAQSPLFGRRTAQIHLQPFTFREARSLHPALSLAEAARTWFICGGIPAYLLRFDPQRSFEANLREQILDEFAPLYREPEFLLREELRDLHVYYGVLMALAQGAGTAREIAGKTGVPERSLPYYLQQLTELHYVRRRYPLDGGPPVAQRVRFTLEDPLLRFWFRFVFPNLSSLSYLGPDLTFARQIAPSLPAYFGARFEGLGREALPLLYRAEGVQAPFEVGEYWSRDAQIDVVGLRQDGVTDLVECRWGAAPVAARVAEELRARAGHFPNARGARIRLRLFSELPPQGTAPDDLECHDLRGLYGIASDQKI